MMNKLIDEAGYRDKRDSLLNHTALILALEETYMQFIATCLQNSTQAITDDFNSAIELMPFWINYPPLQRGRAPTGQAIPWQEVGETVIGAHAIRSIIQKMPSIRHPGLPSGADIRFMTDDALIHLDIKITGPNDRADEVVASPNQISGDGQYWENGGIKNAPVIINGQRASMIFQPELPPFYIKDDKILVCLTYFLKGVYSVSQLGKQPLDYLELICVPNGLLAFMGINYNQSVSGLFIPGKDEQTHAKKRVRVRMHPLATVDAWRHTLIWKRPTE
ncbi:MAG: BglI family type II restriction endonuclease [Phototrophicales bacterium]|nr:BglI family type II restriction endonuclease [Phototrophicales bacterium]